MSELVIISLVKKVVSIDIINYSVAVVCLFLSPNLSIFIQSLKL